MNKGADKVGTEEWKRVGLGGSENEELQRTGGVHTGDRLGDSSILMKQQDTRWEVADGPGEKSDGMGPLCVLLATGATLRLQKFTKTVHSYEISLPL